MAQTFPEAPSARRPGRSWTIRVVGHRDRTASVTCSSACAMPSRSRDLAALRRFAEAHAAAHARAASVRYDAACGCRREQCALHEGTRVACAGAVLLVLRHDPAVGQVWTLSEVCSACAALMPHTRIIGRATPPPAHAAGPVPADVRPAGIGAGEIGAGDVRPPSAAAVAPPRRVPGGFSAPGANPGGAERFVDRRRGAGRRRGRTGGA
ncbi:hypothetical protein ACF09K_18105 [Streptomyces sp. NPDC014882]|uniref:hypothetical protein n=1 Tax=Streptomyces sp. NPDC014882 TaxID=3364927 RepID=UPI0036FEED8A